MFETWHKMIAMQQSSLDARKVIAHRLPASDFLAGFGFGFGFVSAGRSAHSGYSEPTFLMMERRLR